MSLIDQGASVTSSCTAVWYSGKAAEMYVGRTWFELKLGYLLP